jgi:hypothetical protein
VKIPYSAEKCAPCPTVTAIDRTIPDLHLVTPSGTRFAIKFLRLIYFSQPPPERPERSDMENGMRWNKRVVGGFVISLVILAIIGFFSYQN